MIKCQFCDKKFPTYQGRRIHITRVHKKDQPNGAVVATVSTGAKIREAGTDAINRAIALIEDQRQKLDAALESLRSTL